MSENKTNATKLKCNREYEKRNDRINIVFPSGTRDRIEKAFPGESIGTVIKRIVENELINRGF